MSYPDVVIVRIEHKAFLKHSEQLGSAGEAR